jgi:hypothetical protein
MTDTALSASQTGRAKPDRKIRLTGIAAAIVLPAMIWVIASPVLGADMLVEDATGKEMEIGLPPVLTVSIGAALLGWAFLAVLERFTRHARIIWTIVATVLLLLSLVPLSGPMSGGTRATLALLHLAVGIPLIAAFWRSAPAR